METHLSEVTTTAALAEKKKLRKALWRFDMICYTVVAVIGLNALGAFAANGAQAFTWLVISSLNAPPTEVREVLSSASTLPHMLTGASKRALVWFCSDFWADALRHGECPCFGAGPAPHSRVG